MWVFALIFDMLVTLLSGAPAESLWADDLDHRNDRGKLKKPSDKYVC